MVLIMSENVTFSIGVHHGIPFMTHVPFVSTLVELSSTSLQSTLVDVAHLNYTSHSHGIDIGLATLSSTTSSGSVDSNSTIFHYGEDDLESLTTLDYPWDDPDHHSYFLPQQCILFD
jgi:hypothetical protein